MVLEFGELSTSALIVTGEQVPPDTNHVETWDGSSWTEVQS